MAISSKAFTESPDLVPLELKKNFTQMSELDRRSKYLLDNIKKKIENYRSSLKLQTRTVIYNEIMIAFKTVQDHVDEKMKLTSQTHDLVDKYLGTLKANIKHKNNKKQDIPCINNVNYSALHVCEIAPNPQSDMSIDIDSAHDDEQSTSLTSSNQHSVPIDQKIPTKS